MKIKVWESKMGCDVRQGRLFLEVWCHGGVSRLVKDNTSPTGYFKTHWVDVSRGTWEEMAAAAVESWRTNRQAWQECRFGA